jgi:hypothetical protein
VTVDELAALGPFFAAGLHGYGETPAAPWRSVRDLTDDPNVLDGRVTRVRSALARGGLPDSVALRVAASVAQLGLVARLIAPAVATGALQTAMAPDDSWWQDQLGGPFPLSISLHEISRIDPLVGVVESITAATASAYSVPLRTVWGNIASATNGAAQMIARNRPDLASRACDVADAILADPRVEGGRLRSRSSFRRTSCCLIYQLDREARSLCGDCVLQPAATG